MAKKNANLTSDPSKIMTEGVCLEFSLSKVWSVRAVSQDVVEVRARDTSEDEGQINQDVMHVAKEIMRCQELQAIHSLDNWFTEFLKTRRVPTSLFRRGVYLFTYSNIKEVLGLIERFQTERTKLVESFVAIVPEVKLRDKERLGPLFSSENYPEAEDLRTAFSVKWRMFEWGGPPARVREIDSDLFARMEEEARAEVRKAAVEIEQALCSSLDEWIKKMIDNLTGGEDGKPKRFREDTLDNLKDFLDALPGRNITGKKTLSEIAAKARAVLANDVFASDLKTKAELRQTVVAEFQKLGQATTTMLAERPQRRRMGKE